MISFSIVGQFIVFAIGWDTLERYTNIIFAVSFSITETNLYEIFHND